MWAYHQLSLFLIIQLTWWSVIAIFGSKHQHGLAHLKVPQNFDPSSTFSLTAIQLQTWFWQTSGCRRTIDSHSASHMVSANLGCMWNHLSIFTNGIPSNYRISVTYARLHCHLREENKTVSEALIHEHFMCVVRRKIQGSSIYNNYILLSIIQVKQSLQDNDGNVHLQSVCIQAYKTKQIYSTYCICTAEKKTDNSFPLQKCFKWLSHLHIFRCHKIKKRRNELD